MPTGDSAITINLQDATGAAAVATYGEIIIVGEDGHKVETFTPKGIAAQPTNITGAIINGISQFSGLTDGVKVLAYDSTLDTLVWDGGTAVDVSGAGAGTDYFVYDSNGANFLHINVVYATLPVGDQNDNITIQTGVLADQITILQLEDDLLTAVPVINDAADSTCTAAGTYPLPTAAGNYAINSADEEFIAIKNGAGSTTLSVDYSIYNLPRKYSSLTSVDNDHLSGSEISLAAAKAFANGAPTVNVINAYDGDSKEYATVLASLESLAYDYDIMVPCVDVGDANGVLVITHATTYNKVVICAKIGTVSTVNSSMNGLTKDESQYAIGYDTTTYSVAELSGAAAGVIAAKKPWIPCEWGVVAGINAAGYTADQIATLETNRVNTVITVGTSVVLSSGMALALGTWLDIMRTKQYLSDSVKNDLISLKLRLAASNQKIPYTPAGVKQVTGSIERSCRIAQKVGALREDYVNDSGDVVKGYVVSVPAFEDISAADKAARLLDDITVIVYLSGAVSTITLDPFTVTL